MLNDVKWLKNAQNKKFKAKKRRLCQEEHCDKSNPWNNNPTKLLPNLYLEYDSSIGPE